ncbi:TetR/AcrR family transcriptional regulator [Pseudonocardia sp.]|jgi:AcrR family transcriptional regulator|uniref:TetR/AcrR family transcriptional regulator n=1 Tax=Pseudonocardia sp. TaxID=60912 RepID=UPI003D0B7A51
MPRPKVHDEALRARLLEQAGETLSTQGLDALSLRKLAADADTSTTAVYALFGGKPALLAALVDEAFRRLAAHLERVRTTDDPVEDLVALGLAYRDSALADPHLHDVMFGGAAREGDPPAAAFAPLRRAADRAAAEGRLRAGVRPETVTLGVWATLHGLTAAELRGVGPGCADDVKVVFETVLRATVAAWAT